MPNSPIAELVEAAPARMQKPYTEDVTDYVFEAIEADPALCHQYKDLCERYTSANLSGPANVNPTISDWVEKLAGLTVLSSGRRALRSCLIRTYSKFG